MATPTEIIDHKFRFRIDKRARWITLLALLLIAGGVGWLFYSSGGSYLPAWVTTVIGSNAITPAALMAIILNLILPKPEQ